MISFVYFDVGGVVMKDVASGSAWAKLKQDWGVRPEDTKRFNTFYWEAEKQVSRGKKTVDALVMEISKEFSLSFPQGYSMLEDYASRFSRNETIIPVLTYVQKSVPIGLLTNMYPGMLDIIRKQQLLPEVTWSMVIDSSVVGAIKPDREIYEIARAKIGIPANEILFVDNLKQNTEGALAAGLQAYWYDQADYAASSELLLEYLQKNLK